MVNETIQKWNRQIKHINEKHSGPGLMFGALGGMAGGLILVDNRRKRDEAAMIHMVSGALVGGLVGVNYPFAIAVSIMGGAVGILTGTIDV